MIALVAAVIFAIVAILKLSFKDFELALFELKLR